MLSRQSASRPRLAAHRRNRGHDRLPPEDGHARGAKAVSPTQPRDRVLPRLDQKQTGTAPVPPARLGQSANGNALGLPHLQPATVDPTAQAASRICRRLKPQRRDRSREAPYANQTTLPLSHLHSTLALLLGYGKWFFHSFKAREVAHPRHRHCTSGGSYLFWSLLELGAVLVFHAAARALALAIWSGLICFSACSRCNGANLSP